MAKKKSKGHTVRGRLWFRMCENIVTVTLDGPLHEAESERIADVHISDIPDFVAGLTDIANGLRIPIPRKPK